MEKILEFLLSIINDVLPFYTVKQYEMGVILRGGKFLRVTNPGFHFKIPFFDDVIKSVVVVTTLTIPVQSITTKDNKDVVIKSVVKYTIDDIKSFTLNVYDAIDAISDTTQAIIKEQITTKTWEQCRNPNVDNEITKKLRTEVKRWGINIEKVTLTDIGIIRSIRLFNENIINS